MEKYSADWIRQQATEKKASWLPNHACGLCGVDVGYLIYDQDVFYRSGCGCSWSSDRPSDFGEIANWLAMQSSDDIRDKIMAKLL